MKNKGLFIGVIVAALVGIGLVLTYYTYSNRFNTLVALYNTQVNDNKAVYDEVWKVVKQQAQVSDQYAENFKKVYVDLMEARNYGGESFKWIQEQNPNFSPDMYMRLMTTIEAERTKFTAGQRKMNSIYQEIVILTKNFPSSIFVGGRELPKLELITSTKTENTYSTGKEDDVDVFNKK